MARSAAYEAAGVNLEAGDDASEIFHKITGQTWKNRAGQFGEPQTFSTGFRGTRGVGLDRLFELHERFPDEEFVQYHCADGAGNKPKIAQALAVHDTIGEDVVAMVGDDATATGAEAISFVDVLIVNTLGKSTDSPEKRGRISSYLVSLAEGLRNGANKAGMVIENGEIAEHGEGVDGIGEFRYDLIGAGYWLANKERLLDGSRIKAGSAVVALADEGFGCNGYSLLIKQLEQLYGHEWYHHPFNEETTWGEELLRSSEIYSGLFVELTGGYRPDVKAAADVQALVHNTGGGIPGKFGSKLQGTGKGAVLDNLFQPTPAMRRFQELTGISDEELYNVLHMGQRGLVVTSEPDTVIERAVARGIQAQLAGEITNGSEIEVVSRGITDYGQRLRFPVEE